MKDPSEVLVVTTQVNGDRHERAVPARRLLVHFLRDELGLQGTHVGCDTGTCGACTVLVDGQPTKSCMVLAVQADGRQVTTVEGLSPAGGELSPLQRAFSQAHALQCGYCTPGFLLSAQALLERDPDPSEEEIRRAFKGNVCRCTGYVNQVRAVQAVARGDAGEEGHAADPPRKEFAQ